MKENMTGKARKAVKAVGLLLVGLLLGFLVLRFVGQRILDRTPEGGINEDFYVKINGTEQWISIYGEDIHNPVLLYLHGGPGSATSTYDYAFTRKWADVYTVVTWDQRNCGKSYTESQNGTELTCEMFLQDGLEMTRFLLEYLGKEKLTILGHSWGSYLGANLVLAYPEYYACYIGTGQLVDYQENEAAFAEAAAQWADGDETGMELVDQLVTAEGAMEYFTARNALMARYGYGVFADGTDYSLTGAQIFNPYYSIGDFVTYLRADLTAYTAFIGSEEFEKFSLLGRTVYGVPYFNINGDRDYQTNYKIAQAYFDAVEAPYKQIFLMKDTTHGLLESKSEEFSQILHEIAEMAVD